MTSPPLSIVVPFVVPFYEGELVESTLSAVLRDNAEFIFVDDGSSDGTRERLLEGARRWPNVHVIVHEKPGRGCSCAEPSAHRFDNQQLATKRDQRVKTLAP